MLALVIVPAGLTLHTVRESAARADLPAAASRFGYTISLLLFIVPSLAIVLWFMPREGIRISKRAFLWSLALLFPGGAALDFFFARCFFVFPNTQATLRVLAPALGGGVPVEGYSA